MRMISKTYQFPADLIELVEQLARDHDVSEAKVMREFVKVARQHTNDPFLLPLRFSDSTTVNEQNEAKHV